MIDSGISYCSSDLSIQNELKNQSNEINEAFFSQYSWNAAFGAISYEVELTHISTQQQNNVETSDTFVSTTGLPLGMYTVKVTAKFANQSTSIIVEEMVEF